jgi:dTDP-4-dehydrorhamnose reductase
MMGRGIKKDKKFINKIFRQIQEGKKELFIVDDKLGTPTYTKSFTEGIFKIVQTEQYGLYNQVCQGDCNRYEAAKEFIRLLGLENEIRIKKVNSDFFNKEYFAPRTESERLINLKLKERKLDFMPSWQEALKKYTMEFINHL